MGALDRCGLAPCGLLGPLWAPWALVGPLGSSGPGPCGPHGPLWAGILWVPCARRCGPGPCGLPLGFRGLGPCGLPWGFMGGALVPPPGPLWAGPLCRPWALRGRALMGTLVNQRIRSMANPLLSGTKPCICIYIYLCILYIYISLCAHLYKYINGFSKAPSKVRNRASCVAPAHTTTDWTSHRPKTAHSRD